MWLLKVFSISTGFMTILLLWFKVLGTLVEIYFKVINDFIPFQVFLILFQLDLKFFEKICFFSEGRIKYSCILCTHYDYIISYGVL